MQLSSILILSAAAVAAASPLAGQQLQARDPSDKSGNSYVVLHVSQQTLPNTPATSIALLQKALKYRGPDGIDHTDLPCSQPWTDGNCYQCTVSDDQFKSDIVVKACWDPPSNPQISFTYNGHDYNTWSSQSTCGHVKNNQPFTGTMDATCYFNA